MVEVGVFQRRVGHVKRKFQIEGTYRPLTFVGIKKLGDYRFMLYQNIGSVFFHFVTKHACDG